jgi:hypothetical protein
LVDASPGGGGAVFIASDLTPTPLAPWSDKIGEWIGKSRILTVTGRRFECLEHKLDAVAAEFNINRADTDVEHRT